VRSYETLRTPRASLEARNSPSKSHSL